MDTVTFSQLGSLYNFYLIYIITLTVIYLDSQDINSLHLQIDTKKQHFDKKYFWVFSYCRYCIVLRFNWLLLQIKKVCVLIYSNHYRKVEVL